MVSWSELLLKIEYFLTFKNSKTGTFMETPFFLSISGTVYIESVMPVNLGDTWSPDHMEVFWMNGIPNVNCAVICLLKKNCKRNKRHIDISIKLPHSSETVDGIMINLTEIKTLCVLLRNYEIFRGKQAPHWGKRIPDDERLYQSWTSASLICDELGGYLPVFNSRKDLEDLDLDLVSFLKTGRFPMKN